MSRPALLIRTIGAVAAVLLGAAGCSNDDDAATAVMPAIALTPLAVDGSTTETTEAPVMADQIAGPALINLWATWCGPCRTEMPAFQAVADDGGPVRIVGINEGDDRDAAVSFLDDVGVHFDQLIDPDGQIIGELRIVGLPATIVLGAEGTIVTVHQGVLDEAGIRELIDAATA